MRLDSQLHRPRKANYHAAGIPGEEGYAHWIEVFDDAWNRVALCVDSPADARKIESAARACAEAMEAEEAASKTDTEPAPAPEANAAAE